MALESLSERVYPSDMTRAPLLWATLSLLLAAGTSFGADICGNDAVHLKLSFVAGDQLTIAEGPDGCRELRQLVAGRPDGDSEDAFERRWQAALPLTSLPPDDARKTELLYRSRWISDHAKRGPAAPKNPAPPPDSKRVQARARNLASSLGSMRGDPGEMPAGSPPAGPVPSGPPGPTGETPAQIAARLSAQKYDSLRFKESPVPEVHTLNAIGDPELAPEPSLSARAAHLADKLSGKEERTAAQTLAAVKTLAVALTPDELQKISGFDPANSASAERFTQWLGSMPEKDRPVIVYGVLPKGVLGTTDPRTGDITLNHSLINEPPMAQAAVLAHELFHHWDFKASGNFHEETSNYGGYVAPENVPALEYTPYALTKAFADHATVDGRSVLLNDLRKLPDDAEELKNYVQKVLTQGTKK